MARLKTLDEHEQKSILLGFRITPDENTLVERICKEINITRSDLLRRILQEILKEYSKETTNKNTLALG